MRKINILAIASLLLLSFQVVANKVDDESSSVEGQQKQMLTMESSSYQNIMQEFVAYLNKLPESTRKSIIEYENQLQKFQGDDNFEQALEALILEFVQTQDLVALQAKIILLLQKILKKGAYNSSDISLSKLREQKRERDLEKISQFLTENIAKKKMQSSIQGLVKPKDKMLYLTPSSLKRLIKDLKKLAIYEVYKLLNPKRIAGETQEQNFISNCVLRGIKVAKKYSGDKFATKENMNQINAIRSRMNKEYKGWELRKH